MFERFTDRARQIVVQAKEEAIRHNHNYIGTEHILLGLIRVGEGVAVKALESLGISLEAVRQQVEEIIGQGQQAPSGPLPFTPRGKKVLELSLREALQLGHNYIGTEHILLGLIREGDGVAAQVLVKLGADHNRVRQQVIQLLHGKKLPTSAASGSTESAPSTSLVLDQFGRNLTQGAREDRLDPVIGRDREIERVMQVLSRRAPSSPILVGEHGVGKTTVVEGLAQRIYRGDVAAPFKGKLVYEIDMRALVERSSGRDDTNAQMEKILNEVRTRGDIILFLDELRVQSLDIWPILGAGELRVIGALTPGEYTELLNEHPVLRRTFVAVQVAELKVPETVEILKGLREGYEAHHRVSIGEEVLAVAAELADRRLPGRRLPGKAIDILDEAAALCRIRCTSEPPDLREYDEKIAQVRREKESAIDSQDFEKAANLRTTERQVLAQKEDAEREWRFGEVSEELVAETLAIMLGLSPDGAIDAVRASAVRAQRVQPGAVRDDDREVWGMA